MKQLFLNIFLCLMCLMMQAQKEFHVFPNGSPLGIGSLQSPWDLQTALIQKSDVVNGGDTIWLHEGIYNGRFLSKIQSTIDGAFITVAPYNNEKVILNGNTQSEHNAVLNIRGKQVIYRDFEITWLGKFSRDENDTNFRVGGGINHTSGQDCRFYNLIIHDNPGLGIGSWKQTGGTIIENCIIYYNGYVAKDGKGRGEGLYVQNASDKTRLIKNNIIFANYYKGIEVWSAGRDAAFDFVKNITLQDNVIFNSGVPSGNHYDNVIVATDDRSETNFATNIKVLNNVFYHNTDYVNNEVNGDAPSLTLGFTKKAPVEDILVSGNVILGRNNALRLLHIKSMTLTDNIIYGGYVFLNDVEMKYSENWKVNNNQYFTKNGTPFRIDKDKSYKIEDWQSTFNLDKDSKWNPIKEFDLDNVLSINERAQKPNSFNIALFNKQGSHVTVDFSNQAISKGSSYTIYDVENRKEILASGIVDDSKKIVFPMNSTKFKKPLNNDVAQKTSSNFGVFIIEFEAAKTTATEELNGLQKLLKWLGF